MCASRLAVSVLAALAKGPQHRLRHVVLDLARDDAKANRVMCALRAACARLARSGDGREPSGSTSRSKRFRNAARAAWVVSLGSRLAWRL